MPLAAAVPEKREQTVVRADEAPCVGLDDNGIALAADPGVHHGEKHRMRGIFERQGKEQMHRRLDAEVGGVVQRVDDRYARSARGEDCLDLPYVEIARTEVGEENDQAALADALLDFVSSVFFSAFFLPLSSGCAGAAVSAACSVSITSASGALSPLRKPVLRIRR